MSRPAGEKRPDTVPKSRQNPYLCAVSGRMPLRTPWECRGRAVSDPYLRRLFTVGTCRETAGRFRLPALTGHGTRFDPGKEFPFREHRAAAEFLVRDGFFVDQIVECRPCGGDPLFGKESGGILDIHSVGLDGFVLAPEIGEFRKDGIYCFADDRLQLRRSGNDNGVVHRVMNLWFHDAKE